VLWRQTHAKVRLVLAVAGLRHAQVVGEQPDAVQLVNEAAEDGAATARVRQQDVDVAAVLLAAVAPRKKSETQPRSR
jgi:hypothetical protein